MEYNDVSQSNENAHSEKIEDILGAVPSSLTRWNTIVILVILIICIIVICTFSYPYSEGESIIHHILG